MKIQRYLEGGPFGPTSVLWILNPVVWKSRSCFEKVALADVEELVMNAVRFGVGPLEFELGYEGARRDL